MTKNTKDWMKYEAVQSSIIEYLYSVMPDFGLKNYQYLNNNHAFSENKEGAYCDYKPES